MTPLPERLISVGKELSQRYHPVPGVGVHSAVQSAAVSLSSEVVRQTLFPFVPMTLVHEVASHATKSIVVPRLSLRVRESQGEVLFKRRHSVSELQVGESVFCISTFGVILGYAS